MDGTRGEHKGVRTMVCAFACAAHVLALSDLHNLTCAWAARQDDGSRWSTGGAPREALTLYGRHLR